MLRLALVLLLGCRSGFDLLDDAGTGGDASDAGADAMGMSVVAPRSVGLGFYGACAVRDDGQLWCWGDALRDPGSFLSSITCPGIDDDPAPARVGTDSDWSRVSIELARGHAIKTDGSLWAWGVNQNLLGDGTTTDRPAPFQIGSATDWTAIAAGVATCGLRGAGELWCWGQGGAVGDGTMMARNAPVQIAIGQTFKMITGQRGVRCAIDTNDHLWCWGYNTYSNIGNGGNMDANAPVQIGTATWRWIATSIFATCGIQTDGTLWCWGQQFTTNSPNLIDAQTDWISVGTGNSYVCGIRPSGLYCFGKNYYGVQGNGDDETVVASPTLVDAGSWSAVVSGEYSNCGVRDNVLVCAGRGDHGQLGDGSARWSFAPSPVIGGPWTSFDVSRSHACAIATDNKLWCWGGNFDGEVGLTVGYAKSAPHQVDSNTWAQVSVGDGSTRTIRGGQLYELGYVPSSESGGSLSSSFSMLVPQATWTTVSASGGHDCGLDNGQLRCWGRNASGQLGLSSTTFYYTPTQVTPGTFTRVSAGTNFTCGLQTGGALWCWGANNLGQLGDSSLTMRTAPVHIGTAMWTAVDAGEMHTCGIQSDGTLWCWGDNAEGELGDGTTMPRTAPVQVGTATDWISISAGLQVTCGIRGGGSGSLWCWGNGTWGQLGDGAVSPRRTTPGQVGTQTTWTSVRVGQYGGCAMDIGGQLICWGATFYGIRGHGLASSSTFHPVQL